MNTFLAIKDFILYKEPKKIQRFELLEDEEEDLGLYKNDEKPVQSSPKGVKKLLKSLGKTDQPNESSQESEKEKSGQNKDRLFKDLNKNLQRIEQEFHIPTNQDIVIREFKIMKQINAFIVYVDGMEDKEIINDYILRQLMTEQDIKENPQISLDDITNNLLAVNQTTKHTEFDQSIAGILNGLTALFIEGCEECILIESRGYETRSIAEPKAETVIKGPQEGFTENLRTNITLIRRTIRNKDLVTEFMPLGEMGNSTCALMYIKGMINPIIVQEAKRRIASLDVDIITGNGHLEQLIEDHPLSLFPQLLTTERPDNTAFNLMYGKMAILCEGSPFASLAPITLYHFFRSSEDTNMRWHFSTFLKLIRWVSAFFAMFLPGIYIALTLFHKEMIPTELLLSFAMGRETIPVPSLLELLAMESIFELIREAGVRVPGAIGQALGIIGAIVLGQAAIAAGLVSPILIMIVAITGLSSFAIPNYGLAFSIRLMRFIVIIAGGLAGFYGIMVSVVILGGLACSMKSFGVPYFSPVAPKTKSTHDHIIVPPPWMNTERADYLNTKNRNRTAGTIRGWMSQSGRRKDK